MKSSGPSAVSTPFGTNQGFSSLGRTTTILARAYRAVFRLQTTKASGSAREADNPVPPSRRLQRAGSGPTKKSVPKSRGDRNAFHLISSTTAQTARWSSV